MHETQCRFARSAIRRGRSWLPLALVWAAVGCATTTVSLDATPRVSQSVAKRDLGIDYLTTRRTGMAIRELRAALELDPQDPQSHLWLGEAYRRKGHNEEAESYLLSAIELGDDVGDEQTAQEARLNLSALLAQIGRYEESIELCSELVEDPTLSTPWRPLTNCGWAQMKLGRVEEARQSFRDALDFFPRYGPALLNLGILESDQNHRLVAVRLFERALDTRLAGSGRAEANYRMGELYVALGRRDLALGHFQQAAETAPDLEWGHQSQAYLDLLR